VAVKLPAQYAKLLRQVKTMNTAYEKSLTTPNAPGVARSISFLGITVEPLTIEELTGVVSKEIALERKCVVGNHNLNSLSLFHREPRFREFYELSEHTHIDGMPIVALARIYGFNVRRDQRVTYADWVWPLMETAASKRWRVFYLGSKPGVAEMGAAKLQERYPGLQIKTRDGYFKTDAGNAENEAVLQSIADYQPDLLMVGMGMPRQELWIVENFSKLQARVILPSGAAIDYVAGAVKTPPRWAGRCGLEWAFRLAAEPKRLWRRYLVEPWSILGVAVRYFFKERFSRQPRTKD